MKMKHLPFAVFGFLSLVLISCAPVYIPNVINAPLLSNAGEVQLTVYTATSGFDPQFALALSDNIGIMLNGSFDEITYQDSDDYRKHKFFEMGAGYYKKLNENFRFETFGGYGFGTIQADGSNYQWISQWDSHTAINSKRFFFQPAVGATFQPIEFCFSARIVHLRLTQKDRSSQSMFFEPAVTGKLIYKRLRGVMQLGFSLPVGSYDLALEYQPVMLSLGLGVNFGKLNE
ncbi:MAG: hypothetical protein IH597_02570 [Bacteroidales bacterium]|nr:hypothetical protein [Bacteroidales bacterium]